MGVSIHDFQDWRRQQTSFEDIAAYFGETVNVGGTEGRPIRYLGDYASAHLFDILRVRPILGRTFRPEEDHPSTPPVMILSYRAWQDRFNGDPAIVGRTVRANAQLTTIVGVMPERFDFPGPMDAWLPFGSTPCLLPQRRTGVRRDATPGRGPAQGRRQPGAGPGEMCGDRRPPGDGVSRMRTRASASPRCGRPTPSSDPTPPRMLYTMLVRCSACSSSPARTSRTCCWRGRRSQQGGGDPHRPGGRPRPDHRTACWRRLRAGRGRGRGGTRSSPKSAMDFFNAGLATLEMPLWFVARLEPAVLAFVVRAHGALDPTGRHHPGAARLEARTSPRS